MTAEPQPRTLREITRGFDLGVSAEKIKRFDDLTRRQLQITMRLAQGMTVKEIAADLGVSAKSIGNLVGRAVRKLGENSQCRLIVVYEVAMASKRRAA